MIPFDYAAASDTGRAVATVTARPGAAFLAGGTNLVDHMKLGVATPDMLVDVTRLPLDRIEELPDGGLRIGATVRNSDLAAHPLVRGSYPVLSQALLAGASGQLRNAATTAGNLLQRTRCGYFQDVTTPCNKREPGTGCAAVGGWNRHHAVLGASEHCLAVHPSDLAVAMSALDAVVSVLGEDGERRIPLREFHRLPGDRPERDTVLAHGELVTSVELPPLPAGARSGYRKVRERASFAFALVSAGAVVVADAERVHEARIAFGGLAHKPWRATHAEEALRGAAPTEENFMRAADAELRHASPLRGNAFKIPMTRNALAELLRELTTQERR
ncbi:xanthine dehydrogenase family protein subunit M [Streptomyces bathyalis]|uniref:Xanthine dehydrogenase family protein subunit M n=1 Tax=Streptomyces bathyalis TaxID=2710756 RepID=A0A7T1T343_9ACTN|nr:xanthine dehydrogenase family protein subunit M [Streptomyces bathyalis]QPP05510.1 xanthine dehydrogenase family protein subunit M [Streptomyces bathyalis]